MHQSSERRDASVRLRLVSETDATSCASASGDASRTALGVWRLECSSARRLPDELARRLIAHYSDPGELVVAAAGAGAALRQARRLGRRALALSVREPSPPTRSNLTELRPNERADLAIALLRKRSLAELQLPQLCDRVKPGAFIVVVPADVRHTLGEIVNACQQQGLQYWQHVVALDPAERESAADTCRGRAQYARRCHRDLLVFRRDTEAAGRTTTARAAAAVAA